MIRGGEITTPLLRSNSLQLSKIIKEGRPQSNALHEAIVKKKWDEGVLLAKAQLKTQPFQKDPMLLLAVCYFMKGNYVLF